MIQQFSFLVQNIFPCTVHVDVIINSSIKQYVKTHKNIFNKIFCSLWYQSNRDLGKVLCSYFIPSVKPLEKLFSTSCQREQLIVIARS